MVVVPAVTPVTTPVEELIVATAGLLDVHEEVPVVVLDNVVVDPTQTDVVPVMDTDGIVLIVIVALSEFVPQAFVA